MFKQISVKAPAKVNLTLDITGIRDDGYHLMQMVMQAVSLYDYIQINQTETTEITLSCNFSELPMNHDNIAYKVAQAFFRETGIVNNGLHISLEKNIPFGAGLGGGSADGAGVLVGLNSLYGNVLSQQQLVSVGQTIGADIPFCIVGATALVEGIGEKIIPLADVPPCYIVIAKPSESVNTKLAFLTYDNHTNIVHPDTNEMISAIKERDVVKVSKQLHNVFEQAISFNSILDLKRLMKQQGALNAIMTGSGSAVFGIFTELKKANKCCHKIKKQQIEAFVCQPVSHGAVLENIS